MGKYGWAEENGLTCNVTCTGNSNEICGGVLANSVYYTPLIQTTTTTTESTLSQSVLTMNANTFVLTSKQQIDRNSMRKGLFFSGPKTKKTQNNF